MENGDDHGGDDNPCELCEHNYFLKLMLINLGLSQCSGIPLDMMCSFKH